VPTIADVAERAGVSLVTVSRVINGASHVRPETSDRVRQAIAELGYIPNTAAQSLRSRRTHSLALLIPDVTNVFWTTVARGVEDAAQASGYAVLLCNTDENPAKQRQYLDVVAGRNVDGVIMAPSDADVRHLVRFRERRVLTVLVDRRVAGWEVDSVCGDSFAGARALVDHLLAHGHRRIAMISGPEGASTAEDRVAGYRAALEAAGIEIDDRLVRRGEYRALSGQQLAAGLVEEGLGTTAIFAANNVIAIGVCEALAAHRLRVPQDMAVVCMDDLPDASRLWPFLTVAAQPAREMGVRAAEMLLQRLEGGRELPPRRLVLPARLIVRQSCGEHSREL
jgi:LacI family transcriptional regulator